MLTAGLSLVSAICQSLSTTLDCATFPHTDTIYRRRYNRAQTVFLMELKEMMNTTDQHLYQKLLQHAHTHAQPKQWTLTELFSVKDINGMKPQLLSVDITTALWRLQHAQLCTVNKQASYTAEADGWKTEVVQAITSLNSSFKTSTLNDLFALKLLVWH